jgi:cell division protease FtsH
VEKVTLIPRGQAKGLTWFTPEEEQGLVTRNQLLARIMGLLGGRVAEEVVFGSDEVTTGAMSDIEKITYLARQMVTRFGMSDLGLVALESDADSSFLGNDWFSRRTDHSEVISASIDAQVRSIVSFCYAQAQAIIQNNRPLIDRLVDLLIEQETIEGDLLRQILEQCGQEISPSLARVS